MPLTKRKLRKIRQKVYRENKPDMLTDIYYVYDNPALMQDTYTAKCLTNKVLSNELHPNKLSGKKYPYTLSYTDIYKEIKRETDEQQTQLYRKMHNSKAAQGVIRRTVQSVTTTYKALKAYHQAPGKFTGKPRFPRYLRHPRTSFALNNQTFSVKEGYLRIHSYGFKTKVYQHYDRNNQEYDPVYKQITVMPIYHGVKLCCSYEAPASKPLKPDNGIYVGADPGVNNFMALASNKNVQPLLINGRIMKSQNQWMNKEVARLRHQHSQEDQCTYEIKTKYGLITRKVESHAVQKVFEKRNRQIHAECHNAIMCVIAYMQSCGSNTGIVGKNKYWKQGSNMGKKNNQNFIGLPHALVIEKLQYRAAMEGLVVLTTNESYTSQTSFLDGEKPVRQNGNDARKKQGKFPIKRRTSRGVFVPDINPKHRINADVNAAEQIIKKIVPMALIQYSRGIEGVVLQPIKVNPNDVSRVRKTDFEWHSHVSKQA